MSKAARALNRTSRPVAALAITLSLLSTGRAQDTLPPDREMTIDLAAGMIRYFRVVRPFNEVNIGDSQVADVASVQTDRILVTAKKPGQTDIMISDEKNSVIARLHVKVVSPQQYGRRTVMVRRFTGDGKILTHTVYCDRLPGTDEGPCSFEKTEPNLVSAPVISTGPVFTTGPVSAGQ
jgi:Flp pilus assembly secretin CpaC